MANIRATRGTTTPPPPALDTAVASARSVPPNARTAPGLSSALAARALALFGDLTSREAHHPDGDLHTVHFVVAEEAFNRPSGSEPIRIDYGSNSPLFGILALWTRRAGPFD